MRSITTTRAPHTEAPRAPKAGRLTALRAGNHSSAVAPSSSKLPAQQEVSGRQLYSVLESIRSLKFQSVTIVDATRD